MKKLEKGLLRKQVEVYLHWRKRTGLTSNYEGWLEVFINISLKVDILDIGPEDVQLFLDKVYEVANTQTDKNTAKTAIEGLVKYYGARGKNGKTRLVMGRPPHIGQIETVKKYRKMGLKFRDIEKLMGKDIKTIHRWSKFPLNLFK